MRKFGRSADGFTLIELIVVVAISMLFVIYEFDRNIKAADEARGVTVGKQLKTIGDAVGEYIRHRVVPLSATTHTDLTVADLQPTYLDPNVAATNFFGTGYKIRIRRNGASAPYRFDALVITDAPLLFDGNPRFDVLGKALQTFGGSMGMTYDATDVNGQGGAVLAKLDASGFGSWAWTPAFTPNATGGHLAYYVNGANDLDNTYLRIDGGNSMTGNLNFTAGAITNPSSVTSLGDITTSGGNLLAPSTDSGKGLVIAQSDVQITSLSTRASGATSTSLKSVAPKLTELSAMLVSHGTVVAKPTCESGGTPAIFIVPQNTMGNVDAATWGYNMLATSSGSNWTITMTQQDGITPLPPGLDPYTHAPGYTQQAVARVFCNY